MYPCCKYKQRQAWSVRCQNSNGMIELQIWVNNSSLICSNCGNDGFVILQVCPFPCVQIELPFPRLIPASFRHLTKTAQIGNSHQHVIYVSRDIRFLHWLGKNSLFYHSVTGHETSRWPKAVWHQSYCLLINCRQLKKEEICFSFLCQPL